jgi:hypothetical protein
MFSRKKGEVRIEKRKLNDECSLYLILLELLHQGVLDGLDV